MFPNYKKQDGISFVEVMVAMVILSIVVLAMSNVLISTSKSMSAVMGDDVAEMIALEVLAKLQNQQADEDVSPYKRNYRGTDYIISAEISDSKPARVLVKVSWDNEKKSKEIIGYIAADNSCPVHEDSNSAPSNITFERNGTDLGSPATLHVGLGEITVNSVIAKISATDAQTAIGDVIKFSITDEFGDDGAFTLVGNTLISKISLAVKAYTIQITATDCNEESIKKVIVINVSKKPIAPDFQQGNESIYENSPTGTVVANLTAFCENDVEWTISSTDFNLSTTQTSPNNHSLKLLSIAPFDFENDPKSYTVTVTATNTAGTRPATSQTFTISVEDLNEKPTAITFSGVSTPTIKDTDPAKAVANLIITDHDAEDLSSTNYSFLFKNMKRNGASYTKSHFGVERASPSMKVWRIKTINLPIPEGKYTFDLEVRDNRAQNEQTMSANLSILVTKLSLCNDPKYHVWNSSTNYDASPQYTWEVTYNGKVYKNNPSPSNGWNVGNVPPDPAKWVEIGECAIPVSTALPCNDPKYHVWNSSTNYDASPQNTWEVSHNGKVYKNNPSPSNGWNAGNQPPHADKWVEIGECKQ